MDRAVLRRRSDRHRAHRDSRVIKERVHDRDRHHNMQQAAGQRQAAFFTTELSEKGDRRTGVLVEFDRTGTIFSTPSDERTENYVTGRFG